MFVLKEWVIKSTYENMKKCFALSRIEKKGAYITFQLQNQN